MGGGRGSGEVEVPAGVAGVRCFSGLLGRETNDVVCLGSWQKVELKLEGEEEEGGVNSAGNIGRLNESMQTR